MKYKVHKIKGYLSVMCNAPRDFFRTPFWFETTCKNCLKHKPKKGKKSSGTEQDLYDRIDASQKSAEE